MSRQAVTTPAAISLRDVQAAEHRIRAYLQPTPLRQYRVLDAVVGCGIGVHVKHENFQPTGSFKVRNGLAVVTALSPEERRFGLVAATKGNHGQGLAYAGALLGAPVTLVVPSDNIPDKNAAMVALGAELVPGGRDYDEATAIAMEIAGGRGMRLAHSTNDASVLAGAGTITLEVLRQQPDLDAILVAVGGGSQAVGAIVVAQALCPGLKVFGVQAEGAAACHDSWHAGARLTYPRADTFADGIATRATYDLAFPTLLGGLAGLMKLRTELAGRQVALVLSGANIDGDTLARVLSGAL